MHCCLLVNGTWHATGGSQQPQLFSKVILCFFPKQIKKVVNDMFKMENKQSLITLYQRHIQNPVKHLKIKLFAEKVTVFSR